MRMVSRMSTSQSDRGNLYAGIILGVLILSKLWGICMATNIGNRDLLLTNIGTVEIFSVRYGTYPGEKYLPSYASGVHRESKDD